MSRNVPLLTEVCLPCVEDEHDTCHNLLWAAGCECPHTSWLEPRCGILGRPKDARRSTRRYVCDLPALDRHRMHEGRYFFDAEPSPESLSWGWTRKPQRWSWRRVILAPGRFDPFDPTAPSNTDRSVA
jgi:hypothetical protein